MKAEVKALTKLCVWQYMRKYFSSISRILRERYKYDMF
jgi:hypothetical protein